MPGGIFWAKFKWFFNNGKPWLAENRFTSSTIVADAYTPVMATRTPRPVWATLSTPYACCNCCGVYPQIIHGTSVGYGLGGNETDAE